MTKRFVYFMKPVGMEGPIKIGCSEAPEERLLTLAAWSPFPLEVIATIPGNFDLEAKVHNRFAHLHSHKEWFRIGPDLRACVFRLNRGLSIEQAIDLDNATGKVRKYNKEGSKVRRSYFAKINGRLRGWEKRTGRNLNAPEWVDAIMGRWAGYRAWQDERREPTPDELASLDQFIAGLPETAAGAQVA